MKRISNKQVLDQILEKYNLQLLGNEEQYLRLCEDIRDKFKTNWRKYCELYIPIFIKRGLVHGLFDIILEASKINAVTIDKFVLVYGEDWGKLKWNEYRDKQKTTNTYSYKNQKYGMTKEEFDEYNKSRAITKENLAKKYGDIEGKEKYSEYVEKQKITKSKSYYVEKYGEKMWEDLCKSKAHNLDTYITRYGDEEIATKKLMDFYDKMFTSSPNKYSKISQELFEQLDILLEPKYSYYARKNKEFCVYSPQESRAYFYDYVIIDYKICIEFNGDYYHANPTKYPPDYYVSKKKMFAKDIWKFDSTKNEFLSKMGYAVLVVWEADYRNNKEDVIERIVNYVRENRIKGI